MHGFCGYEANRFGIPIVHFTMIKAHVHHICHKLSFNPQNWLVECYVID